MRKLFARRDIKTDPAWAKEENNEVTRYPHHCRYNGWLCSFWPGRLRRWRHCSRLGGGGRGENFIPICRTASPHIEMIRNGRSVRTTVALSVLASLTIYVGNMAMPLRHVTDRKCQCHLREIRPCSLWAYASAH